jgi:sugar (pentulose or hexulose) kinase
MHIEGIVCILVFDIGTSAVKSSLVSPEGQILDFVFFEYKVENPGYGQVE